MRQYLAGCAVLILLISSHLNASERSTSKVFEQIKNDPVLLRQFLYRFPKGGDIHSHLDGAAYAENMIKWAAPDGRCVTLHSM